jgi:hypothetical protein
VVVEEGGVVVDFERLVVDFERLVVDGEVAAFPYPISDRGERGLPVAHRA